MFEKKIRTHTKFAAIATVAVAAIAAFATGTRAADPAKLTFQLNYPAAGYNAGYAVLEAR